MPNFFKKKNKSYGVSSKENTAPLATVRPLSAAFGTDAIMHIDEEETGKKKSKVRDRGAVKSVKGNNTRSRSTSVPARPKSSSFGSHILPQEHVIEQKRNHSPVARKKSTGSRNSLIDKEYSLHSHIDFQSLKGEEDNRSRSHNPKTTVIRYTEKQMIDGGSSKTGDLWSSSVNPNGDLDIYETIYGSVLQDKSGGLKGASSEEELPDSPFPREPSLRVHNNTYYNHRKFSTFAPEEEQLDVSNAQRRYSAEVKAGPASFANHIYDVPDNHINNSHGSTDTSNINNHYEATDSHTELIQSSVNKRRGPLPPRRSSSLLFEDVAISSEPYQPMGTFIAPPTHGKEKSFEEFQGSIVHITHESTKNSEETLKQTSINIAKIDSPATGLTSKNNECEIDNRSSDKQGVPSNENFTDLNSIINSQEQDISNPFLYQNNQGETESPKQSDVHSQKSDVEIDAISLNMENSQNSSQGLVAKVIGKCYSDDFADEIVSEISHPGSDYTLKDMEIADQYGESHEFMDTNPALTLDDLVIPNLSKDGENTKYETNWDIQSAEVSPNFCIEMTKISRNNSEVLQSQNMYFGMNDNQETVAEENNRLYPVKTPVKDDSIYIDSEIKCNGNLVNNESKFTIGPDPVDEEIKQSAVEQQVKSEPKLEQIEPENKTEDSVNGPKDQKFVKLEQIEPENVTDAVNNKIHGVKENVEETISPAMEKEFNKQHIGSSVVSVSAMVKSLNSKVSHTMPHTVIKASDETGVIRQTSMETVNHAEISKVPFRKSMSEESKEGKHGDSHHKLYSHEKELTRKNEEVYVNAVVANESKNDVVDIVESTNEVQSVPGNQISLPVLQKKPLVPYKPAKLGAKWNNQLHSESNEQVIKPFLSKPQRFVPGTSLINNKGRVSDDHLNKTNGKSSPPSISGSTSYVFQKVSKFSKLSTDGNGSGETDLKVNYTLSNTKSEIEPKTLERHLHKEPSSEVKADELSKAPYVPTGRSFKTSVFAPRPFKAPHLGINSTKTGAKKEEPVLFLDSLKKKESMKRETPITVLTRSTENENMNDSDKKESELSEQSVVKPSELKMDVTSFLDGLKQPGRRESFNRNSESEVEKKTLIMPSDYSNNTSNKTNFSGISNLLLEPVNQEDNTSEKSAKSETKSIMSKSRKEALFKEACQLPETNIDSDCNQLEEKDSCEDLTGTEIGTFLSLKNIDSLTHKEQSNVSRGILSPRQLKRSKGKFSNVHSGERDRAVRLVQKRNRTVSTESSGIDDSNSEPSHSEFDFVSTSKQTVISKTISDECQDISVDYIEPNQSDNNLSCSFHSIGSEHSAFSPVRSDDEAERGIEVESQELKNLQIKEAENSITEQFISDYTQLSNDSPRVTENLPINGAENAINNTNTPTPPPRRNRDKRRSRNLDSSLNSDKSSIHTSSYCSSDVSGNKELTLISQKLNNSFVPVDDNSIKTYGRTEDVESEQGVCMPWDNTPWESSADAADEGEPFSCDDIPSPVLINGHMDGDINVSSNSEYTMEHHVSSINEGSHLRSYPSLEDIPSPKSVSPSSVIYESTSEHIIQNNMQKKNVQYMTNLDQDNRPYDGSVQTIHHNNNKEDKVDSISKHDINGFHEHDPPSASQASETVSQIFEETVRLSSHTSFDNLNDVRSAEDQYKFERNMRTIRSPTASHRERAIDVQYLEHNGSSSPSLYSERAIDIQDLDTSGKPMSISKHYEERGVDVEGIMPYTSPKSPLVGLTKTNKARSTSRLSENSSQYTNYSKSVSTGKPGSTSISSKDHSKTSVDYSKPASVSSSYSKDSRSQYDAVSLQSSTSQKSANSKGFLSPKATQHFFEEISEFSGLGSKMQDLNSVNLPGLRLNPSRGAGRGPIKGTEHLHPALERSLRTPAIAQNVASRDTTGTMTGMNIDTELMVLVEDDYMTPRPGYNHAVMQNKDVPEPWSLEMLHNWKSSQKTSSEELGRTNPIQRQDSVLSEVTNTTVSADHRWQTIPIDQWENEDTVDWAEAVGFDELADALHGTGIGGGQLLMLEDQILIDLGIINAELRYQILEELERLKDQPKAEVPLWSLKQASVRRKNLEASSNVLKSRLSNLQQLNSRQEHQIESYLEELKEQQKQTEILLHSPQPPSETSHKNYGHVNNRNNTGLTRMNSINTDVSAVLPALSVTDSEVSVAQVPQIPLQHWDNSDVLQWLTASGLYIFSNKFYTHKVTGEDLSEISMQFLDKIGIDSLEEREILLSKLYELQHPGEPSLEELLRTKSDTAMEHHNDTDFPTSEQSLRSPTEGSSSSAKGSGKRSSVVMGTKMVSKEMRESPWTPASTRKSRTLSIEEQEMTGKNVLIWHQLGGTTTSSYVAIGEQSTCYDVIQRLLNQQRVMDDPNLFFLVDKESSGREIEVAKAITMSHVQQKWENPMAHKLELKQKSGLQIKVTYKAEDREARTKTFRVATCSSYSEVLLVACRKFRITQYSNFILMELYRDTGHVHHIPVSKNISELISDNFLLCDGKFVKEAEDLAKMLLKRRASAASHTSSNLSDTTSQATVTSSRVGQLQGIDAQMVELDSTSYMVESGEDTDDNDEDEGVNDENAANSSYPLYHPKQQNNQFQSKSLHNFLVDGTNVSSSKLFDNGQIKPMHKHFRSMDEFDHWNSGDIEKPRRRVLSAGNDLDHVGVNTPGSIELLQELALLKESLQERDITMLDLKKENKELKARNREMVFDQNRLKSLEEIFNEKQESWKSAMEMLQHDVHILQEEKMDRDPEAKIKYLEEQVEKSRSKIWKHEEDINNMKAQLEDHANGENPQAQVVEYLQSQLSQGENVLLTLKQEHGDLLKDLKNTEKKLELKQVSSTLDLYTLIGSDKPPCLHALELEPKNGSYGLIIGRDKEKRLMVRHTEEGRPILKGDRLIEVNGRLVAKMEDEEIANFLKKAKERSGSLRLVVLREPEPIKDFVTKEEHESLKDDLSLALMELESTQQDHQDLTAELQTLKYNLDDMKRQKNNMEKQLDQLKLKETEPNPLVDNGMVISFADASPHTRLQLMLDTLNAGKPQEQAVTSSQLRRGASRRGLDWFNTLVSVDRLDQVLAYDELDEKLPLYESMKIAPKSDVLQALKDTILETRQQKAYLDKLMGLVIDHAPFLLKSVDTSMGLEDDLLSIKSRTEERC